MSFSATCWAWSIENLKSSEKLTLLAFCQYANEEKRIAYPSIDTVANCTGLNKKTVQANIVKLMDKGLMIDTGKRVGKTLSCRVFHIPFQTYKELLEAIPKTGMLDSEAIPKTDLSDPKNGQEAIPKTGSKPVIESGNSNQDNSEAKASPRKVMDLYNKVFKGTSAQQMLDLTPTRESHLRARIKNDISDLNEWEEFFEWLKESDFLMGRITTPGRKTFQLKLGWIANSENMMKILERTYHGQ